MVTSLIKKIIPEEFQPLLQTTKNAYVSGNSLIIQPKLGQVVFNFKDVRCDTCVVRLKRDSGNGILMISANGISRGYQINSRISQSISFPVGDDGLVQVHRTNRSRGDISILDVSLYAETMDATDWNVQINKCDKHHCLRLIGDNLHASDGAFIQGNILRIQTEPNNMFTNKDGIVRFLGSCKIIDLEVGGENIRRDIDPVLNLPVEPERVRSDLLVEDVRLGNKEEPVVPAGLFDTNATGFSPVYGSNDSVVNVSGVVLDRHGSYNIPLKNINHGKKYRVDITVSRIDGNGKFMFNILPNPSGSVVKMASNEDRTFSIETAPSVSSSYSLSVWRHPSSKGRIRISRIVVSGGVESVLEPEIIKHRQIRPIQNRAPEPPKPVVKPLPPPSIINYSDDYVMRDVIRFADYNFSKPSHQSRPISISTTSGMRWLSKIQSSTNNFHIDDKSDVLICSIDSIKEAKKVFLDSFTEDKITDKIIESLSKTDVIYTPTEQGVSALMNKLDGKDIRCLARVWPYTQPVSIPFLETKDFIVLPNRNDQVTRLVIDALHGLNIVVLGARGRYPQNVIPVNEYLQYNKLLWLIQKAKTVVDFHNVEDHKSGLLDITMNLGTPIVTSSWNYMNFANIIFVDSSQEVGDYRVPSQADITEAVYNAKDKGLENIQAQKDAFESFIKEMT